MDYEDPGTRMADNCTLCAIPMVLMIILIFVQGWWLLIILGAILFGKWIAYCRQAAAYAGGPIVAVMLMSLTIGWFSFPFVLMKRIGIKP